MRPEDFTDDAPGRLVDTEIDGDTFAAFDPDELPPAELGEDIDRLLEAHGRAREALGRLAATPTGAVDIEAVARRIEAVFSSRIENVPVDLDGLYVVEAGHGHRLNDREHNGAKLALGYLDALDACPDGAVNTEHAAYLHRRLFNRIEVDGFSPGEVRERQNFIGRARRPDRATYVPPPPELVRDRLAGLFEYASSPSDYPPLVCAGIAHYQFETIHPFPDGNGRVGRVLIDHLLRQLGVHDGPCLPVSEYLYRHRRDYYDLLLAVSQRGAWGDWLEFFLTAVAEAADATRRRLNGLRALSEECDEQFGGGRRATHRAILRKGLSVPYFDISDAAAAADVHYNTANRVVSDLEDAGFVEETTGNSRERLYRFPRALTVIDEE